MARTREVLRGVVKERGISLHLVMNFDQLWQMLWRPKKRHCVWTLERSEATSYKETRRVRGKQSRIWKHRPSRDVRLDHVQNFRSGVTVVTSTWADGTPGPVGISIKPGFLGQRDISAFNKLHIGKYYIMESTCESATHFMNADTTVELIEKLIGPATMIQRRKWHLLDSDPAFLIADAFTGNYATGQGEHMRRTRVAEEYNLILPLEPPGGWSAKGWNFSSCAI